MRRNLVLFSLVCVFALSCFLAIYAQTSDRIDLSGKYAGELKFPSANLNGKATLNVEGNKFELRNAEGAAKTGRITAIKTGGDYVSIALMFEETPAENQPFTHSMMSVRMRKTGKDLIFASAPGEEREFQFKAVAENANATNKTAANTDNNRETNCPDPKNPNCGVAYGFVKSDEFDRAATPKTNKSASKPNGKTAKTLTLKNANSSNNTEKQATETAKSNDNQTASAAPANNATQPETIPVADAKRQDEANTGVFKAATEEMRRATVELKRASDEVRAATDELRRFRTNSSNINSRRYGNAASSNKFAVKKSKTNVGNANKTARGNSFSTKAKLDKPNASKNSTAKNAASKTKVKKSAVSKSAPKNEAPKPANQTEKSKANDSAEPADANPSPTPAASPAKSLNKNANNADVGKAPQ